MRFFYILIVSVISSFCVTAQNNTFLQQAAEYSKNKDYANAVIHAKKAVKAEPNDLRANIHLSWYQMNNHEFSDALTTIQSANEIFLVNPDNSLKPFLLLNTAHAYLLNADYEKAMALYNQNFELSLNGKSWYNAALEDFMFFLKLEINKPGLNRAISELQHKTISADIIFKDAEQYEMSVKLNSEIINNPEIHRNLWLSNEEWESMSDKEKKFLIDIILSGSYNNRAEAREALHIYTGAASDFQRALALDSSNAYYTQGRLANIYRNGLNDPQKAYVYSKKAYIGKPDFQSYRRLFVELGIETGKLDETISLIKPNDLAVAYYRISTIYHNKKQYDKSLTYINKALEQNPEDEDGIIRKSRILSDQGADDQALAVLQKAIQKEPENPSYYFWRANAYKNAGKDEKAIADYQKYAELKPSGIENTYYPLAKIYCKLEKYEKALKNINNKLCIDKDNYNYALKLEITLNMKSSVFAKSDKELKNKIADLHSLCGLNRKLSKISMTFQQYDPDIDEYDSSAPISNDCLVEVVNLSEMYDYLVRDIEAAVQTNQILQRDRGIIREGINNSYDYEKLVILNEYMQKSDFSQGATNKAASELKELKEMKNAVFSELGF